MGVSPAGWIAGGLVSVSTVLIAVWMVAGLGVGAAQLSRLEANSFLGRMGHSSEGREMIWKSLGRRYARSPMGIGPGNSRWQTVTIEERERPIAGHLDTFDTGADPFLSKESHNDYIAYLLERGPIALAGMLLLRWQIFVRILKGRVGARATRERMATGAVTAAMFGAWVASCLNSNTIETLHFRHVWVFLAMVCAMQLRSVSVGPSWGARAEMAPTLSPARISP
jgi:O-antigen ligase